MDGVGEHAPVQLSLGVSLNDDATFANFYLAEGNELVVYALREFSLNRGDQNLLVWGNRGAGLTHLLQACCHLAYEHKISVQYLPLRDLVGYAPEDVCEGLDKVSLVCLDGIDEICGHQAWERALFHLFNRLRDAGNRLLIASHSSPPSLPLTLPDLKSRVLGGVVYHLHGLNDQQKAHALQLRAKARGMDMSDEVAKYILSRAPRDTNELFNLLNRLDDASLQQQRKLTIPFVKEVLSY
ncbi:DnaA regulatory inactivator Hda [Saccharophagus sp. K07]|uniref:DnaA regulatory inactivator Hda n=1 Tax=Saccharophagus sp. K07 TaxID=2283636 RepID=UPI001652789E|nr:DnaA regulatory inactivator Hda [Saccharophagus sp. K07]MBC6905588.1 DnaA regulatory inactivator Hda [Saccharophagus sp. K07]